LPALRRLRARDRELDLVARDQSQPADALRRLLPGERPAGRREPSGTQLRPGALAPARVPLRPRRPAARALPAEPAQTPAAVRLCDLDLPLLSLRRHSGPRFPPVLQAARAVPGSRGALVV